MKKSKFRNTNLKINVMKLIFSSFLIVLSLPLLSQWNNSNSIDEMTGEVSAYCSSPLFSSTKNMVSPYSDTKAWLGIGCDGVSEWVYVGFTNAPNLLDTDTQDGQNVFTTRIKWDDELTSERFIQTWGAKSIQFTDTESAIENIINSNTLLVELNWYENGKTYFRFNLSGSTKAITKMRTKAGYSPPTTSINSNAQVENEIELEIENVELDQITEIQIIEDDVDLEDDTPFMIVENMPAFGDCKSMRGDERHQCTQMEIIRYVSKNTQYPPFAQKELIQGTVFVYFVVGKDGYVKDVKVLREVDSRLDEEAFRVVSSLPKFDPGTQRGKNVSVQYTIPVKFIIR